MKIEWANKTKIPFSHVSAGQCFLDEEDNVCLASDDGWAVILATGEMFEPGASHELEANHELEIRLISAKVVVLEAR